MQNPESRIVEQAGQGEEDAQNELVLRYREPIVCLAARLLGDRHEAQDVAQEALVKALRRLPELAEPSKFGVWLSAIAINECRSRQRKNRPIAMPIPDIPDPAGELDSEGIELGAVLAQTAVEAMDLPSRQAAVFGWFYFYGASYDQIATVIGTTPAAVQSILQRARSCLRKARDRIFRRGESLMEPEQSDLETVVSRPDLAIENLNFGQHRWGPNHIRADVRNLSPSSLYLALDVRTCVAKGTNWQRQWFYELGPEERRDLTEEYEINYILSPWYAVFRGPGVAKIRITLTLPTQQQYQERVVFLNLPDRAIFQKWFELIVPADAGDKGMPVKPVLPTPGDVTLEDLQPESLAPGEHHMRLVLRNHAQEPREVAGRIDTPNWGWKTQRFMLEPMKVTEVKMKYVFHPDVGNPARSSNLGEMRLLVVQCPLNLDELEVDSCFWPSAYRKDVPEQVVAERCFPLTNE